ncbi:MAG: hypothetical protein MMC23_005912 [Stictis urceolatum]|nr:hypothetical protein [Stictis urceolata]
MTAADVSEEQRTAEARAAFLASLNSVGSNTDAALQARAKDIQANSAVLAKQEAEVAKQTEALAKQTAQYQQMADDARGKLKEIGDVQNWAEMLERDLLVLEETIKIAEEEAEEQAAEGNGKKKSGMGWW